MSHFQTLCSRVKFTFILLFRIETMKLNGLKWSQQKDINFSVLMIILRIWNCLLCFVRRRKPNGMVVDFNSDHANSWHLKRHLGMRRGDRNWAGYIEDLNSNPMPIHGENLRLKEKMIVLDERITQSLKITQKCLILQYCERSELVGVPATLAHFLFLPLFVGSD